MPKRTSDFRARLLEDLRDPEEAMHYINAAWQDSRESFLGALRDVAEANQISKIAEATNLNRENLYKMLSPRGNPTLSSLESIFEAVGLRPCVQLLSGPEFTPLFRAGEAQHVFEQPTQDEQLSRAKITRLGVTGRRVTQHRGQGASPRWVDTDVGPTGIEEHANS